MAQSQGQVVDLKLRADQYSGTTAIRAGFEFDVAHLEAWLIEAVDQFTGPLHVEQFKGGQSNPTFKLTSPSGVYVMRSKPAGVLLASAHAIDREYRVLSCLNQTPVPVPKTFALCTDNFVIGRWFYIMSFTPGPVVWDLPTDRWTSAQRGSIWQAGANAVAALHSVDIAAVGLQDFGKTGGYVRRQFKRWSEQYLTHTRDGIDNPAMDRLIAWLPAVLPVNEPTSIVHGDIQLSNMIQRPDGTGVAAIIDWELSTLGNPISDFAYYCRDYHMPPEAGGFAGLADSLGIPAEQNIIERWSAATGFSVGDDWMVYIVFNMFRLAAIRQGVAKRLKDGNAANANAASVAQGAVTLAEHALSLARRLN